MSNQKPTQAMVRRGLLKNKSIAEGLTALDNVCDVGAKCPEVKTSPIALQALNELHQAVKDAHTTLATKLSLNQALMTAIKALDLDFARVKIALATYEAAVAAVAKGDASIINGAGLGSRDAKAAPEPLGKVTSVSSKPGKHPTEAIINWPAAPGATAYAIEMNDTPQNPAGPWTALVAGTNRRRVVKGPSQGAQFLVRVASLGSGGAKSEWSDHILATAL